ncbi:hypothetical protein EJB05_12501 [Eragrostis curvula]|uniref:Myb-like domain-containing protein n=1 Tax=Eragrostis curvula TaxID=38414 RepID=A0A5J9VTY2_9POAL|nr:hypothetical protein EJB05_12501 [Eragrostis curvula]
MESLASPSPPAMLPDLTYPWSPPALPELIEPSPELLELFWPSMEQQMIDDLLDLENAVGHEPQCFPAHDDATMSPEFTDADLAELLKVNRNDAKETEQTNSNHNIKICIKRSKLETCVLTIGVWRGRRQRKCRMRRTSWKVMSDISGFQKPFGCGDRKTTRKNNPHWTADEVDMLVDRLLRYGVGSWTMIKNTYFETSIRTPVHLKDKWKNLREACGPEVKSKNKVKPQKATQKILQRLKDKIIKIDKTRAARPQRA